MIPVDIKSGLREVGRLFGIVALMFSERQDAGIDAGPPRGSMTTSQVCVGFFSSLECGSGLAGCSVLAISTTGGLIDSGSSGRI
jgi:hypothetical protein